MSARKCTGTTKAGKPCHANPVNGTDRCWRHPEIADGSDSPPRAHDEKWSRAQFLDCYEWCGMVVYAAKMVGVSKSTVYLERQRNEDFALAWADVEERSTERMEAEAYRRAVEGVTTPMVSAGKYVTDVQTYSDRLLEFMLKARRPDKYRDRVDLNHSGSVEQRVKVDLAKLDDSELDALERIAEKLA